MDLLCFCSVLCLLCLCVGLFLCALRSPAGKELTSWKKRMPPKEIHEDLGRSRLLIRVLMGGGGGVWYSLFIKNLAHYSSH